ELDEAVGGDDRFVVLGALVERIGRHELRLGRPYRVGVLALDLVERFGRLVIGVVEELIHGGVVKVLDRLLDIGILGAAAPRKQQRAGEETPSQIESGSHRQVQLEPARRRGSGAAASYNMAPERTASLEEESALFRRGPAAAALPTPPPRARGGPWCCSTTPRGRRTAPRAGDDSAHGRSVRRGNGRSPAHLRDRGRRARRAPC